MNNAIRTVVGAIIVDNIDTPTAILAARRTAPPELAGLWEFPGGKMEPGESRPDALVREIQEELGVEITVHDELPNKGKTWPISPNLVLHLYFATIVSGTPSALSSHDSIKWLDSANILEVEWVPADSAAVHLIFGRLARTPPLTL